MTILQPSRRRFFLGVSAFLAAPAIVRVASIMPVSVVDKPYIARRWLPYERPSLFYGNNAPVCTPPHGSVYLTPDGRGYCFQNGAGWVPFHSGGRSIAS